MDSIVMFALFSDGGNCYSSRDNGNWYWTKSEYDETESEFRKRVKRQAIDKAASNYYEYCSSSVKCKFYKSKEKFLRDCEKFGVHPNMDQVNED